MTWLVEVFRVLTACTSLTMMLSPSVVIYRVLRTRTTGHASIFPMMATLGNTHAWMMWGYMAENYFPVFSTYVVGEVCLLAFISIFYAFSTERAYAHRLFVGYGAAIAVATAFALLGGLGVTHQSRHDVAKVLGFVGILGALGMYASPFEKLRLVLRHRSGVFIPIHMTVAGSVNNLTFMIYCYLTKTWILFVPNSCFLCMGLTQATLYVAFHPSTHPFPAAETRIVETETPRKDDLEASRHDISSQYHDAKHLHATAFVALRSPPLAPVAHVTTNPQ